MTESEWLSSSDPLAMLNALTCGHIQIDYVRQTLPPPSDRKLRLWVEACRDRWPYLAGMTNLDNVTRLYSAVRCWSGTQQVEHPAEIAALLREVVGNPFKPVTLPKVPTYPAAMMPDGRWVRHDTNEDAVWCPWLTPTVLMLATATYEQRARKCPYPHQCSGLSHKFGCNCGSVRGVNSCPKCNGTGTLDAGTLDPLTLTALADALEEAGCTSTAILDHLRSPVPHYRGMWSLDLLLGKE